MLHLISAVVAVHVMYQYQHYKKAEKVINGCTTIQQLRVADRYTQLAIRGMDEVLASHLVFLVTLKENALSERPPKKTHEWRVC